MIISMANTEAEKLSGYSRGEIKGKKRWTDFVVHEDLARMQEHHKVREHDGSEAPQSYDFRLIDKAGNVKNIFQKVSFLPGSKKRIVSLIDVTERKQAEENLEESEERFRAVAESSADAILITDEERIIFWNSRSFERAILRRGRFY